MHERGARGVREGTSGAREGHSWQGCKKRGGGHSGGRVTAPYKILARAGKGPILLAKFCLSSIALSKLPYCQSVVQIYIPHF